MCDLQKQQNGVQGEHAYWGGGAENRQIEGWGHVKAIDPSTGQEVWAWRSRYPMLSSLLTTGGDLLFAGEPTGEFNAFNARTGELLWQFQTGNGIHGSPITYRVKWQPVRRGPDPGGGVDQRASRRSCMEPPRGHALVVFALP